MENIKEVAPAVGAMVKGAAVAAKAAAKGAAKGAAAGGKAAAKGAAKGAKGATKPVSKNLKFKRPNVRNPKYKDSKTGQFNRDLYDKDRATYKKIKQDQANRPDMSNVKPDGPSDDRTKRGERKLKAIDKITDKKKEDIKQNLQTTGDVAKKTADVTGKVVKKTASVAKKATGGAVGAFGTSSFRKEGITFKDYLNKL